ncbi:MAG: cytochrome c [Planctomycetes bacterium]|nr:cytochrome c [Planctomycetota bacterium]
MTCRRVQIVIVGMALSALLPCVAADAKESAGPAKRARPPKWSADVLDAFFEDAREKLVGSRPDYSATTDVVVADSAPPAASDGGATPTGAAWSNVIDAETIETEIKRLGQELAKAVTTPSEFKGGKYEDCRRLFSELAVLFAVAAEYDGDVRWKDSAPGLRDRFARAGRNCKVGTDQTFKESIQRKQDLSDLIAGSRPNVPQAERAADWGQVADRPPLMQRLNIAHEERLTKWLANQRQFEANRDDVRHEAQLVAAIADVVGREGFDYWDEDEYAKHVRELRQAAADVSAAVELDNYEQAQKAINRATKACADCHELYRE